VSIVIRQTRTHILAPLVLVASIASAAAADVALPDPLRLADVTSVALRNRAEVSAATAQADALAERPAIVSALEDPMITTSIGYPDESMMGVDRRYDRSISIEQRFPLSRVRSHRRAVALADADRARARADATGLDVVLDARRSFFMLLERGGQPLRQRHQHAGGCLARRSGSRASASRATGIAGADSGG
jgi:hypothetical protein